MPEHVMSAAPAQQSSFVTGLAWTLIVFNALGVLVVLIRSLAPDVAVPGYETSLMGSRVTGLVLLAISAFLTYAAYELLKRRNWARITYILFCALAIVSHLVCAATLLAEMDTIVEVAVAAAGGGAEVPPEVASVVAVTIIVFAIFLIAMCVLYGWLIKRLRSPAVKAEFAS
jgi:hypothetical protein